VRTTDTQRREIEQRIRSATTHLLRGEIPPGGKCDITTLARQAGISRPTLYRSYPHLKKEFEQQLARLRADGDPPDPRDAQIARLKHENATLRKRLAERDTALQDAAAFKTMTISRLAAQHEEIQRLRVSRKPSPCLGGARPPTHSVHIFV
jgi:hypothetical protein